jgi:hypothetical protein
LYTDVGTSVWSPKEQRRLRRRSDRQQRCDQRRECRARAASEKAEQCAAAQKEEGGEGTADEGSVHHWEGQVVTLVTAAEAEGLADDPQCVGELIDCPWVAVVEEDDLLKQAEEGTMPPQEDEKTRAAKEEWLKKQPEVVQQLVKEHPELVRPVGGTEACKLSRLRSS